MNKILLTFFFFLFSSIFFYAPSVKAEDTNLAPNTKTVEELLNELDNAPNSSSKSNTPQVNSSKKNNTVSPQKQKNENKFSIQEKLTTDPEPTKHLSIELLYGNYLKDTITDNFSKKNSSFSSAVGAGVNFAVSVYPRLRLGVELSALKPFTNLKVKNTLGYGYTTLDVNFISTISSYIYSELDLYRSKKFNVYALAGVGYSATFTQIKEQVFKENRLLSTDAIMSQISPQEMANLLQNLQNNEQKAIVNSFSLSQAEYEEFQKYNTNNFCDAIDFKSDCEGGHAYDKYLNIDCNVYDKDATIAKNCQERVTVLQEEEVRKAKEDFKTNNPTFNYDAIINNNRHLSALDTNYLSPTSFASGIVGDTFICSAALTPTYLNTFDNLNGNYAMVLGHSTHRVSETNWVNEKNEIKPAPKPQQNGEKPNPYGPWIAADNEKVDARQLNSVFRNEAYDKDIGYFVSRLPVGLTDPAGNQVLDSAGNILPFYSVSVIDYKQGVKQKYENGVLSCAYNFKTVFLNSKEVDISKDAYQFRLCSTSQTDYDNLAAEDKPSINKNQICEKTPTRHIKEAVKKALGGDIASNISYDNFSGDVFSQTRLIGTQYKLESSKTQNAVFSYASYKIGLGANININKNFSYYIKGTYNFNSAIDKLNTASISKNDITKINNYVKIRTSNLSLALGVSYNWY
jgi:hypothetical protein